MAKRYYTLLVRDSSYTARDAGWGVEFGDYDKECVEQERDDKVQSGWPEVKRCDTAIVTSGDTQDAIDAAVAAFVLKQRAAPSKAAVTWQDKGN